MVPEKKRVEFEILLPRAKHVMLSGTFNKWSDMADPMQSYGAGVWKTEKILPGGKHEYKFIVDGDWMIDPGCRDVAINRYGTLNSVIKL